MATPVYGMYMSGLLKDFYDRLLPLSTPYIHRNDDGTFYHEGRMMRLPRLFFLFNSGFPGEHNFELLQAFVALHRKGNAAGVVLEVYRDCGEALNTPADGSSGLAQGISRFRGALKRAGREMVTEGSVSRETVGQLHLKLMSDEEYVTKANRIWDEAIGEA